MGRGTKLTENQLLLRGYEGSNPLHFLAALGALQVTVDADPLARLAWVRDSGAHRPVLYTSIGREQWSALVCNSLVSAGRVDANPAGTKAAQRVVREVGAELKKASEQLKNDLKRAKVQAKQVGIPKSAISKWINESTRSAREVVDALAQKRSEAQMALAIELGFGPAHLGDIIGVSPEVFNLHARHAMESRSDHPQTLGMLAALGNDACITEGKVAPTPYSFSNGASGKSLLKDFRRLVSETLMTAELVEASVNGERRALCDETALNWDPRDLRSYALRWDDPANADAETDVVANALAYLGLSLVPAVPTVRGLGAIAFVDRGFEWPIWRDEIGPTVVMALLAGAAAVHSLGPSDRTKRGILDVWRAEVVNPTGKRNYFGPARPR